MNSEFIMPDVMTLRKAAKNVQHATVNLKTSYLPSIKEKCQRLDYYITQELNEQFRTSLINLKTKLETQNLGTMLNDLDELIIAEKSKSVTSEEDLAALKDEEKKIKVQLKEKAQDVKKLFDSTASNLADKLLNIEDVRIQSEVFLSGQEEKNSQKRDLTKLF